MSNMTHEYPVKVSMTIKITIKHTRILNAVAVRNKTHNGNMKIIIN